MLLISSPDPFIAIGIENYRTRGWDCQKEFNFCIIQVYKGCCRNTGKHLAVKVVLDLTQKVN